MAYNSTLALALRYAVGIKSLDANTTPSSTLAAELHTDAFGVCQAALIAAEIDPTDANVTGILRTTVEHCEAVITSANLILSKMSLGAEAMAHWQSMIDAAMAKLDKIAKHQAQWLAQGGIAANVASGWAHSHGTDDADPAIDQTPGGDCVPFAKEPTFEWTDSP